MANSDSTDTAVLRRFIMGFRLTQMVYVAARLGIADHLREGPRSPRTLARAVGAHAPSLARLLRGLASVGIFRETDAGEFELTQRAQLLRSDTQGSLHALALLYGEDWLWQAYGNTLHAVRTGQPGFDHAHGDSLYRCLQARPHAAASFDHAMSGYSVLEARAIAQAYDFSSAGSILDVGGGHGALAMALLDSHPALRATVFDLAGTILQASHTAAQRGLSERCACVAGDFFVEVPQAQGVVLLKSVLHNWDDARAGLILRNCRRAMQPGTRLLVAERVLVPGNEATEAALFDINMLVVIGGQERTAAQYRALLAQTGFALTRIIATASALSLIEAAPVP